MYVQKVCKCPGAQWFQEGNQPPSSLSPRGKARLVADIQDFTVVFSELEKHADSREQAEIRSSEIGFVCLILIWFSALQLEPG